MKNNNNTSKKSKGFYIALYSCLGLLVAGGAALTLTLVTDSHQDMPSSVAVPVDTFSTPELPPSSMLPPSLPTTSAEQTAGIREFFNIGGEEEDTVTPTDEVTPSDDVTSPTSEDVETEAAPQETQEVAPTTQDIQEESVPVFNFFSDEMTMLWPVVGEVVMDYSTDHLIFDPTLNQWRTNDKINIAAETGTVVRTVAEGLVVSVGEDRRLGNTITIDHGNGWATTYSQIDTITVSEGDVVAAGQIIAQVSEPTIFASELGDNIGFRVTLEDTTVNPLSVLAQY